MTWQLVTVCICLPLLVAAGLRTCVEAQREMPEVLR